ncbi:43373_t:CDS:2, partial [Gigaspora margarita]
EWTIAFRQQLLVRDNHTNNFAELLSVAHNRLDNFIALHFRLSGWKIGSKNDIKVIRYDSMTFEHRSSKNSDKWYFVDMQLGICKCNTTGAPYKHQSAISTYYR